MLQILAQARQMGVPRAEALGLHALGAVQYLLGEWQESLANLSRSLHMHREMGAVFGDILSAQRLAQLETPMGRHQEAYRRLLQALDQARSSDSLLVRFHSMTRLFATLAENRLEAGELDRASQYLAAGLAAQQECGECASCDVLLYPAAVPIYLSLGEVTAAEAACTRAEETAEAFGSQAWRAVAACLRGRVHLARGELWAAAGSLETARVLFEALEQPYDLARTLEQEARVLEALGREAEPLRARARALCGRLGAVALRP
ncbi:MAG TPA: hypothetical protein VNO81_03735 [Candidatus Nitrosotenuis sp.]|nr:hypothetical protein [Candidatus Nitrosotenuis sp.]